MASNLIVNVQLGTSSPRPINANLSWYVHKLKEEIAEKHGVPVEDVVIIFQGIEMDNESRLENYDLGNQTVLNAIVKKKSNNTQKVGLNEISHLVQDEEVGFTRRHINKRYEYYVYCKTVCQEIKPGKLRVCCSACLSGAFKVERGPNSWEDVQTPGRISGQCLTENCPGEKAEFYFKCSGHETEPREMGLVLNRVRSNRRNAPCITCYQVSSPVLRFPCTEKHSVCLECFADYCSVSLQNRQFVQTHQHGYTLTCPAGCVDSCIEDAHHFRVLGPELYDRFLRFGTEEFVLQMGGILCPAPGCGAGLMPDDDSRMVVCLRNGGVGCGFIFCRLCKHEYHDNECDNTATSGPVQLHSTRKINPEQFALNKASEQTISNTTKACPKCKVPTEKHGGCMHMVCTRCHYPWCWLCVVEWNRDCQGDHWFDAD